MPNLKRPKRESIYFKSNSIQSKDTSALFYEMINAFLIFYQHIQSNYEMDNDLQVGPAHIEADEKATVSGLEPGGQTSMYAERYWRGAPATFYRAPFRPPKFRPPRTCLRFM
jgi:hypothetical protein